MAHAYHSFRLRVDQMHILTKKNTKLPTENFNWPAMSSSWLHEYHLFMTFSEYDKALPTGLRTRITSYDKSITKAEKEVVSICQSVRIFPSRKLMDKFIWFLCGGEFNFEM